MFSLFKALFARLKALFVTDAALDVEAEFLARDAERKANLLRQADRYEQEGLHGIAQLWGFGSLQLATAAEDFEPLLRAALDAHLGPEGDR